MLLFFVFMELIVGSYCSFLTPNETETVLVPSKRAISPRALSGSTTSKHGTKYELHLEWTATQDKSTLTSTITATFYIKLLSATASDTGMYNQYPSGSNAPTLTITIGETTALSTVKMFDFRSQSAGYTDAKGSGSATVSHNADGSKSVTISASLATQISSQGTLSISTTAALDTIPVSVTIKFDGNGGTASQASTTVTYNQPYGTLATATRDGYTFNGWYTAKSGGNKVEAGSTVSVTSTQTLYAQWAANEYTVTFDGNGGTASTTSTTVTYDQLYGTLATATRDGYTFNGWYTALSGGSKVEAGTTANIIADSHTLYAQWIADEYTVTFDGNGGTVSTTSTTITYDQPYGTLATATRDGYTFNGWYTAKSGGTKVEAGTAANIIAGSHTLYAQWTVNKLTITFTNPGGEDIDPISEDYGTEITLPNATKTGHTFVCWLDESENVFAETSMPAKSVTLHPQYYVNNYTITINIDGNATEITKPYGTTIILPVPTIVPDGYSFEWWEDADGANYGDVYVVSGDDNLTAIWTPNVYSVSFMVDSGETIVYNVSYGSVIEPPTVEKSGYVLRGWCLGHENCDSVVDFDKETMPSDDIELYGKWELITDCVEIVFGTSDLEHWKNYINKIAGGEVTSEFTINAYVDDNAKTHVIVKFENINHSVEFYRICNEYARTDDNIVFVGYTSEYRNNLSALISPMTIVTEMIFYILVNI